MVKVAAVFFLCACAGATTCPNDLPSACPSPAPSYAGEVSGLFAAHCVMCHNPNGIVPDKPFDTYAGIYALRTEVLTQVYACRMPYYDGGVPLDETDRLTMLGWLVCGSPNN